ncbi:MAG: DUF192 domain-containing protein [Candidatus Euphemobacter frigidus]|nr:DUF192 domain-containing protein [Candidatus Euphemobacter frigidus]MDP8275279.1 DUF192 domain-containing protein [Candidatus Euphemobacter frigidus]
MRLSTIITIGTASLILLITGGCREGIKTGIIFGEGEVLIGDRKIKVELALTAPQKEQGLKYRRSLPENRGMIFMYSSPVRSPFWMKDTHIPLSIAFINGEGRIISIQKMEPDNDQRLYHPPKPFKYALEMNQGWFEKNNVGVGERVILKN